MPFLIQGSLKQVAESFGAEWIIESGTSHAQVMIDIPRTFFFGTQGQNTRHVEIWSDSQQSPPDHFSQGNMSAENLKNVFHISGVPRSFFKKEELELDEPLLAVADKISTSSFAYIDEDGNPRGFLIHYRKDDPSKWIIAQTKNPNKEPGEAQVQILTSFEPVPPPESGNKTCKITELSSTDQDFLTSLRSAKLEKFVGKILGQDNKVNPAANVIGLFTQNVSISNGFQDNEELLEAFDKRLDEILVNPVYALLLSFSPPLRLTPRQMLACLDRNSTLYQLIIKSPRQEDEHTYARRLGTIIRLDNWQLNDRQELLANDQELEIIIQSLLGRCDPSFLADCLESDVKLKGLQFLTKNTTKGQYMDFVEQLGNVKNEEIWDSLACLAELTWSFPKDKYQYLFISKYLLNSPTASFETLKQLLRALSPALQEVFDPIDLANHLTSLNLDDGGLKYLHQAGRDFSPILQEYKGVAAWRKASLSPALLRELAEKYKRNPDVDYIEQFSFCSSVEQFRAAYSLAETGFSLDVLQGLVMDPDMVFIISSLNDYHLNLALLRDSRHLVVLKEIRAIKDTKERDACLILFAQGQLKADEYFQFRESCNSYPRLAALIVERHKKGFGAEQLKDLAFNSDMHPSASFLSLLGIDYRFSQLTPVLCQTSLAIADLVKENKDNPVIKAYLKTILPAVLLSYSEGADPKETFAKARIAAEKELLRDEGSLESKKEFILIQELESFLNGQITLLNSAIALRIDPQLLLMNNRVHAHEAARALALIDAVKARRDENSYILGFDGHSKISAQILEGFTNLDADAKANEEITTTAVSALIDVHLEEPEAAAELPFEQLLTNRKLARAIVGFAAHGWPVRPLLEPEKPLSEDILLALNTLNDLESDQQEAYALAMQDDEKGHDFRLLLTQIPVAKRPELVSMLYKGITENRKNPISDMIADSYKSQRLKNLAYRLDESLIIINRLRELEFDNEVIDFALKNNERSRYFFMAVARIEAESEATRNRLSLEHPAKFVLLNNGPEKAYRTALYQAMFDALNADETATKDDLKAKLEQDIKNADSCIEDFLPMESHYWLRTAKMVITNLVMGLLTVITLGAASVGFYQHREKTGDLLFFARPASEESYKAINKQTVDEVTEIINATTPKR